MFALLLCMLLVLVPVVCPAQELSVSSASAVHTLTLQHLADTGMALTTTTGGMVPICHPQPDAPAVARQHDQPGRVTAPTLGNMFPLMDCRTVECGQVVSTQADTSARRYALPTPALIPTEHDFCPAYANLTEEQVGDHQRFYRCTREDGVMLWQKSWCGAVPRETTAIAAPQCTGEGTSAALLGLPHFHCDLETLTWRFHCRDMTGQLQWDVPL